MIFALQRLTEPAIEPVSLAQAIQHLREDADANQATQDEISGLITSAREWVEHETGTSLIDSYWRLTIGNGGYAYSTPVPLVPPIYVTGNELPREDGSILLRRYPVIAVTKFVSVANDGTETPVDADGYVLRDAGSKRPRLFPTSGAPWASGTYIIEYRAGFANRVGSPTEGAEKVPARMKAAMRLHIQAHYDQDERTMEKLLQAAGNLLCGLSGDVPVA